MQLWFDGCGFIQPIRGAGNEKYCLGGGYNVIICMSQGGGGGLQAKSVIPRNACKQNLSVMGVLCRQKCLSQEFHRRSLS